MGLLIQLLLVLAFFAIVWWAVTKLSLPEPIRIVAIVIMAIVALLMLAQFIGGGPVLHGRLI